MHAGASPREQPSYSEAMVMRQRALGVTLCYCSTCLAAPCFPAGRDEVPG